MRYIYLSIVLKYTFWVSVLYLSIIFFWKLMTLTSVHLKQNPLYFSLHYISIKVLEVESCYYVAALKAWVIFYFSSKMWFFIQTAFK